MEETFTIEFLGFIGPRPQDGHLVLASAFGLSEGDAKLLVVTAPKVVARGVGRERFEALTHALSAVNIRLLTTNEQTGEKEQHPPAVSLPLPVDEQPARIPPGPASFRPPGRPEQPPNPPALPRRRSSGHYASVGGVKSDKLPPGRIGAGTGPQVSVRPAPSGSHPDVRSKAPSGSYVGTDSRPGSGSHEDVREGQTSGSLPMILKQIEQSGAYTETDDDLSINTVFEDAGDGLVPPEPPKRPKQKPKSRAEKKVERRAAKNVKNKTATKAKSRALKYRKQVIAREIKRRTGKTSNMRWLLIVAGVLVVACLLYLVL